MFEYVAGVISRTVEKGAHIPSLCTADIASCVRIGKIFILSLFLSCGAEHIVLAKQQKLFCTFWIVMLLSKESLSLFLIANSQLKSKDNVCYLALQILLYDVQTFECVIC